METEFPVCLELSCGTHSIGCTGSIHYLSPSSTLEIASVAHMVLSLLGHGIISWLLLVKVHFLVKVQVNLSV